MGVTAATGPLGLTGERTLPGVPAENYWFQRHLAGYAAVPGWVPAGAELVLDAGCGEGYGGRVLARAFPAGRVLGVDYDAAASHHAAHAYGGPTAAYLRGGLTALPLAAATADLVVALQVLEHIWKPRDFVRECLRVLRPGGTMVLSTPNRLTFSPGLGRHERPSNLYHCREYDAEELTELLPQWAPGLSVERVLGLWHGPALAGWERRHGSVVQAQQAGGPASWPVALQDVVAATTRSDFELRTEDLAGCLDLVVVARPPGEERTRGEGRPRAGGLPAPG